MRSRLPRLRRRTLAAVFAVAAAALLAVMSLGGSGEKEPAAAAAAPAASNDAPRSRPQVVDVIGPGDNAEESVQPDAPAGVERDVSDPGSPSPGAPSDADVTAELARLKKHAGGKARLTPDGQAVAPFDAP